DRVMPGVDIAAIAKLGSHAQRAVGAAGRLVDIGDLTGQPDPSEHPQRVRPILPRVVAGLRNAERPAGVPDVDALPGQGVDHREEPFGLMPSFRNTSLIFRATASSVSSWVIRRFAAASSSC